MNSEKVISNIKKAIKEHLDNNYAYDMLVDFELDVIDWNSLFEYIDKLQQENQKYKEVIDKLSSQIKLYGKYNGEKCTRGFSIMTADFNKLLDILKEVSE